MNKDKKEKALFVAKALLMLLSIATLLFVISVIPAESKDKDKDTYLSEEIQGYCVEIGDMYGVCPELLMAIIETESSGNPYATDGVSRGLMQITPKWHRDRMERLGVNDLYNAYGNILVGTDYLMELAGDYGELQYALDVYNGNSKAKYNYENGILSRYAKKVTKRAEELERLHGK